MHAHSLFVYFVLIVVSSRSFSTTNAKGTKGEYYQIFRVTMHNCLTKYRITTMENDPILFRQPPVPEDNCTVDNGSYSRS